MGCRKCFFVMMLVGVVIGGIGPFGYVPARAQRPESRYIDVHMHLDGIYRADTRGVDYVGAAGHLIQLMDEAGVEHAMIQVVPAYAAAFTQAEILAFNRQAVAAYPDRLHLMAGGITLTPLMVETNVTPDLEQTFEATAEGLLDQGAVGFGEMLALHVCLSPTHSYLYVAPDHPLFLLLADVAARRQVPIDLHMEAVPTDMPMPENLRQACDLNPDVLPGTIPALETLLSHNREASIVWQHIGWDNTGFMTVELLRQLLDVHPNLYLALKIEDRPFQVGTSRVPMPNRIVDSAGQIDPAWLVLITDYPDRIMIGADEFVGVEDRATHGVPSFTQTWAILAQLPPEVAQLVGRENAARVYGLN